MKVLILIIASDDPVHENDLQTQFNTWISDCPAEIRVVILRGWKNNFYKFENNVLFVPCREEYLLILKKTIFGIKYILENLDFDILIRTNVSTYYEPKKLIHELNKPRYKKDFAGGYVDRSSQKIWNAKKSFEYISGTGIFLSKNIAKVVSELDPESYINIFDDIAISNHLKLMNVPIIRMSRSNLHSTHFFIPTFHIRLKNSSNSNSASIRMKLVHDFYQAESFYQKLHVYLKICLNEFSESKNSSESWYLYALKNRIVVTSFIKLKKQKMFNTEFIF
jgi:hypothetical protein